MNGTFTPLTNAQMTERTANQTDKRVTYDSIAAMIKSAQFLRPDHPTLTICVITMANGAAIVGESACIDPANFDEEVGKTIAFQNAFSKLWLLEGYNLMSSLTAYAELQGAIDPLLQREQELSERNAPTGN